jgi:hypothetical protein
MTEAEWLACEDPCVLFNCIARRSNIRKIRLVLCGCLRSQAIWDLLKSPVSRQAVEVAEAFVEGAISRQRLRDVQRIATLASQRVSLKSRPAGSAGYLASLVCFADKTLLTYLNRPVDCLEILKPKVEVFRDIFGNPFCPVTLNPSWLTSTVLALANGIYDEKAFDRMPILADALQDAGCDNEDILNHCRQPGEHVKGCWVVDLILSKC